MKSLRKALATARAMNKPIILTPGETYLIDDPDFHPDDAEVIDAEWWETK